MVSDPTPTPTDVAKAPEGLTIRGLERGDAPKVAWVEGSTLHVGGDTIDLPVDDLRDVAVLDDVWVVRGAAEGGDAGIYVIDRDSRDVLHQEVSHHTPLVANSAGTAVAWMSVDGIPRVWQSGLRVPIDHESSGSGSNHQAVALTGERCDADAETVEGAGCTVFFRQQEAGPAYEMTSWASSTHGIVDELGEPFLRLIDVSGDGDTVYAGFLSIEDDHTCSGVSGPHSADVTWQTCDHQLAQFSPDGSLLLAHDSYYDGTGPGTVAVLDARTGDVLLDRNNHDSEAFVGEAVWEDEDHLLATVFEKGEWALVRIGTDGSMELASEPQAGEDAVPPMFLGSGS